MKKRRVVITGIGIISPAGLDKTTYWNNIQSGNSYLKEITRFDTSLFSCKTAAEINDFKAEDYMLRKNARRMDRFVQYACAAARLALEDGAWSVNDSTANRTGVWIGSSLGGIETFEKQHAAMLNKGADKISPFFIPMFISNMAAGQTAILTGAKGPCGCSIKGSSSGNQSIAEAWHIIENNEADLMLAGGTEAPLTATVIAAFEAMQVLSHRNTDNACRPFDNNRDGWILSEGASIVLLEERNHALERGAKIYGELSGYGYSNSANSADNSNTSALKMALANAAIPFKEVNYIQTHGTGSIILDTLEAIDILNSYQQSAARPFLSSIKGLIGHSLGASSSLDLITALLSMENNCILPIFNLNNSSVEFANLNYVTESPRKVNVNTALTCCYNLDKSSSAFLISKNDCQ